MEFVESALLADMIFEWHETPFCKLLGNLQAPQEHSTIMDAMLVDIDVLPEIVVSTPVEPPPPVARPVGGLTRWPDSEGAPPVGVSEALVKLPLAVQRGETLEEGSTTPPAAPFTPRAVKQSKRASNREPESKGVKAPAKSRKRVGAEQVKESRAPTHAEHIIRERQRRDDMAAKYLVLESLLPPSPKRERAVVVADAAVLVKALQQKKVELLKRLADLKVVQAAPNQHSPRISMKKITSNPHLHNSKPPGTTPSYIKQQPGAVLTLVENNSSESHPHLSSSGGAVGEERILTTKSRAASAINVHSGEDDIVVEVLWNRPCPNLQSSLLQAVESLGSEVTGCSILRVASGFLQCVITCSKPQVPSQLKAERQAPETLIMGALRNVLAQSS